MKERTITLGELLKIRKLGAWGRITVTGDFSKCSDENFRKCVAKMVPLRDLKDLAFTPEPHSILNGITATQIKILIPLVEKNILKALYLGMSNAGHQGISATTGLLAENTSLLILSMEYLRTVMSSDTAASFTKFAQEANQHEKLKRLSLMVPVSAPHEASPDSKTVESTDLSEALDKECWAYPTTIVDFMTSLKIRRNIQVTLRVEEIKKEPSRFFYRTANGNLLSTPEKQPDSPKCGCTIS